MSDDNTTGAADAPTFYLSAPGGASALHVADGEDRPSEINGQPVKYFWGTGIGVGTYTHPKKKFTLSVDRKRIDGWVNNFKKMREKGVEVPVVEDHDEKAKKSIGWIVDAKRDGDKLKLLHQMIGDDAILMASRNRISLGINPDFIDGRKNHFGDAVVHSAFTPVPVVSGMGSLIAASRGPATDIYELAASRSISMPTAEEMQEFRKLHGAADVPEEKAFEWLLSHTNECLTLAREAAANEQTLLSRATEAEQQVLTLSAAKTDEPALPDDATRMLLSRAADSEWDKAVKSGGTSPAVAKEFRKLFRDGDKPNLLALSRAGEGSDPLEFQVAALLQKNTERLPATGDATRFQGLSMADDKAKGGDAEQKAVTDSMVAMANGENPDVAGTAVMCKPKKGKAKPVNGD